jgi:hypothetical protein
MNLMLFKIARDFIPYLNSSSRSCIIIIIITTIMDWHSSAQLEHSEKVTDLSALWL